MMDDEWWIVDGGVGCRAVHKEGVASAECSSRYLISAQVLAMSVLPTQKLFYQGLDLCFI